MRGGIIETPTNVDNRGYMTGSASKFDVCFGASVKCCVTIVNRYADGMKMWIVLKFWDESQRKQIHLVT